MTLGCFFHIFKDMKKILTQIAQSRYIKVDKLISNLISNRPLVLYCDLKEKYLLQKIKKMDRLLVISDVNIGDSIMIQTAVEALNYYFPDSRIDFIYNKKVKEMIAENPAIASNFPILNRTISERENRSRQQQLAEVLSSCKYDVIFNFCPVISRKDLSGCRGPILTPTNLVVQIFNACQSDKVAGLSFNIAEYINRLVSQLNPDIRPHKPPYRYRGNSIFLSGHIIQERDRFFDANGISVYDRLVFVNPDTSNIYTNIPPRFFIRLISQLVRSDKIDNVILGASYTFNGTDEIYQDLPEYVQKKVVLSPDKTSLAFDAALVDACDAYVTGDTGPLHIAAARKKNPAGTDGFFNRTAIVNLFKATDHRIYGYDTKHPQMIDSSQAAPAKVLDADLACKNITCTIQRIIKTCDGKNCDAEFNTSSIVGFIVKSIKEKEQEGVAFSNSACRT